VLIPAFTHSAYAPCIHALSRCIQHRQLSAEGQPYTSTHYFKVNLPLLCFFGPGTIPASLGTAKRLANLKLRGNGLNGTLPASIGGLPSLEILDFSGNSLSGAIPDTFGSTPSLAFMMLRDNKFTTLPSGWDTPWTGVPKSLFYILLSNNALVVRATAPKISFQT
jgi:Leucine rich repeat